MYDRRKERERVSLYLSKGFNNPGNACRESVFSGFITHPIHKEWNTILKVK
jgi:hypothetical protein